jgi:hypothetical protein
MALADLAVMACARKGAANNATGLAANNADALKFSEITINIYDYLG